MVRKIPHGTSTKGPAEMFTDDDYRVPEGVQL